jgi:putative hemolysin
MQFLVELQYFWPYLAVILACIVASAFFSGSETALLRLRADELERDAKAARGPGEVAARNLLKSTSRLLVTILVGNNVVNILGTSVSAALFVQLLGEDRGILVSTICMTLIVLLFAEILPKAVAARNPKPVAYAVALPLYLLHKLLMPLHVIFDRLIDPLVKRIAGGRDPQHHGGDTTEEVLRLAKKAKLSEADDGSPMQIIAGTAHAADMKVDEIMVQRTEIFAFPLETSADDLLSKVLDEQYTRIPIYQETLDNIVGLVHFKDLVKANKRGDNDLRRIIKPVIRVPEKKPILRLLTDMQRAFVHLAVVKDEFGVTQGIVTQEDILEEIVGEIRDEFDREELLTIIERPDGSYDALGRVSVRDFNRETGWNITAERGETLSGLVFNKLGHAPRPGDRIEVDAYDVKVLDVSGSRITRVRVFKGHLDDGETKDRSGSEKKSGNPVGGLLSSFSAVRFRIED